MQLCTYLSSVISLFIHTYSVCKRASFFYLVRDRPGRTGPGPAASCMPAAYIVCVCMYVFIYFKLRWYLSLMGMMVQRKNAYAST